MVIPCFAAQGAGHVRVHAVWEEAAAVVGVLQRVVVWVAPAAAGESRAHVCVISVMLVLDGGGFVISRAVLFCCAGM